MIEKETKNKEVIYFLTEEGQNLFKINIIKRQREYIKLILSHLVFYDTLKLYLEKREPPNKREIVELMKKSKLSNLNDNTIDRRSSTVSGWINWILNQIQE